MMRNRNGRLLSGLMICCTAMVGLGGVGCAVGNKHDYGSATPTLRASGSRAVGVAVTDERPYVVKKDKSPDFVGLQRGGFGNPFDIDTASGKPLAAEFRAAIERGLAARGFRPGAAAAERVIRVRIVEWKSDTYNNTALIYDVRLTVEDPSGKVLATSTLNDRDNLGGSSWNPPGHAKSAVPEAFKKKLTELLNAPGVAEALGS